jgi:hypothetical protein
MAQAAESECSMRADLNDGLALRLLANINVGSGLGVSQRGPALDDSLKTMRTGPRTRPGRLDPRAVDGQSRS